MTALPPDLVAGRLPFGQLLRTLRIRAGLSQELLAERARISTDTVSALERGKRRAPQRETLALIVAALALPARDGQQLEMAAKASRPPGRSSAENGSRLTGTLPASSSAEIRVPHNLPHATNSFHGRDRQLSELDELLEDRRLVTLLGTGGVGKTRLALELGRRETQRARFPDGVWLVDLAVVEGPNLVAAAFASTLGIQEIPDATLLTMLEAHLRERELLVIVDNCEHVLDTSAHVVERLLQSCRRITLLTTSREPLNIDGELLFRIEPLALPRPAIATASPAPGAAAPARPHVEIEWLHHSPAAQLFIARAADVQPGIFPEAAAREPGVVAAICERLDGLPLGLELAAARVHELSLSQIEAGLEHRFALLTRGRRLAQPRQQTLLGCINWSYDLLTGAERVVLRRLGVFPAAFTLEAAQSVCSGHVRDAPAEGEPLSEALAALVSKSLVSVERFDAGPITYRLLESVRYFARGLLHGNAEYEAIALRHAEFCRTQTERARERLRHGGSVHESVHAIASAFYDLHAALDWTLGERRNVALGADIVGALAQIRQATENAAEAGPATMTANADADAFGIADILALCRTPVPRRSSRTDEHGEASARLRKSGATQRDYPADDYIFRKGDVARQLFFIVSGTVMLEEIEVTIGANDLLGEVAFFLPSQRRTASARCTTPVSVLSVDHALMPAVFARDPLLRTHVLHVFAKRIMQDLKRMNTAGVWR